MIITLTGIVKACFYSELVSRALMDEPRVAWRRDWSKLKIDDTDSESNSDQGASVAVVQPTVNTMGRVARVESDARPTQELDQDPSTPASSLHIEESVSGDDLPGLAHQNLKQMDEARPVDIPPPAAEHTTTTTASEKLSFHSPEADNAACSVERGATTPPGPQLHAHDCATQEVPSKRTSTHVSSERSTSADAVVAQTKTNCSPSAAATQLPLATVVPNHQCGVSKNRSSTASSEAQIKHSRIPVARRRPVSASVETRRELTASTAPSPRQGVPAPAAPVTQRPRPASSRSQSPGLRLYHVAALSAQRHEAAVKQAAAAKVAAQKLEEAHCTFHPKITVKARSMPRPSGGYAQSHAEQCKRRDARVHADPNDNPPTHPALNPTSVRLVAETGRTAVPLLDRLTADEARREEQRLLREKQAAELRQEAMVGIQRPLTKQESDELVGGLLEWQKQRAEAVARLREEQFKLDTEAPHSPASKVVDPREVIERLANRSPLGDTTRWLDRSIDDAVTGFRPRVSDVTSALAAQAKARIIDEWFDFLAGESAAVLSIEAVAASTQKPTATPLQRELATALRKVKLVGLTREQFHLFAEEYEVAYGPQRWTANGPHRLRDDVKERKQGLSIGPPAISARSREIVKETGRTGGSIVDRLLRAEINRKRKIEMLRREQEEGLRAQCPFAPHPLGPAKSRKSSIGLRCQDIATALDQHCGEWSRELRSAQQPLDSSHNTSHTVSVRPVAFPGTRADPSPDRLPSPVQDASPVVHSLPYGGHSAPPFDTAAPIGTAHPLSEKSVSCDKRSTSKKGVDAHLSTATTTDIVDDLELLLQLGSLCKPRGLKDQAALDNHAVTPSTRRSLREVGRRMAATQADEFVRMALSVKARR